MKNAIRLTVVLTSLLTISFVSAQETQVQHERRPLATATASPQSVTPPNYEFFSMLNGRPRSFVLHHDTLVNTGEPVDVYMFAIEMQVMNSDGDLEPEGLILDNFFTAKPVQPLLAPNPNTARDCKTWNTLILEEIPYDPKLSTWSYVEFSVAQSARIIQTNEDGPVWWSDDVQCWGARDRFPPF